MRIHACAALAVLLAGAPRAPAAPVAEAVPGSTGEPTILVLHSYHRGFTWTDQEMDGILAGLRARWPRIEPWVEHLDRKRALPSVHDEPFLRLLAAKYAGVRFDAVVVTDDAALEFALRHRALLGDAPVSFCGVNGFREGQLDGLRRVSGIFEDVDVAGTIGLVRALQPGVRSLSVVLDDTDTSAAIAAQVAREAHADGGLAVRVVSNVTLDEVVALVGGLSGTADAVLLGSFVRDRAGVFHTYEEIAKSVSRRSAAPVYGLWEFQLGHGIVGGSLLSGAAQGARAAQIAVDLVAGLDPPVDRSAAPRLAVDERVARRFGLAIGAVPEAVLVNREATIWREYRREVLAAAVVFAVLVAAAAVLLLWNRRLHVAERALREGEERYRSIVDAVGDAIFVHDASTFDLVEVNARARELNGLGPSDPLPPELGAARRGTAPYDLAHAHERLRRTVREGSQVFEWLAHLGEGKQAWFEVATRRAVIGGREMIIVTGRDIGERKRAEEERRGLELRLHESQRVEAVGRLAGGIAHDLNNLITPILAYASLAKEQLAPGSPIADDVEVIEIAAMRAREITRRILAFSRRQHLDLRVLDLGHEVESTRDLLRSLIGEDVEIRLALAPDARAVRGDAAQLQQVLMNLALNARDAMPGGGVIEISTRRATPEERASRAGLAGQDWVALAVTDTGIGMDEEVRRHLFEPFFTTKPLGQGTGLGLSTVHGIVKQHGGEIEVLSAPGKGSTFRVWLPAAAPEPSAEVRPGAAAALLARERTGTILLVEDEELVRRLAERVLAAGGYEVVSAPDGPAAVETASRLEGPIALLITDVVMPGMNGRELHARLSAQRPGLAVLFVSGYPAMPGTGTPLLDGDWPLLPKPFTPEELLSRVREALSPAGLLGKHTGTKKDRE